MQIVNLYIYTTVRGPQRQDGGYAYVLETITSKGPATCPDTGELNRVTEHQAYLLALTTAIKRITRRCELIIHIDSVFIESCAEKWLAVWRKNGWKNAKGQQIANVEEWMELALLLDIFKVRFVVGEKNTYSSWLKTESERVKNIVQDRKDHLLSARSRADHFTDYDR